MISGAWPPHSPPNQDCGKGWKRGVVGTGPSQRLQPVVSFTCLHTPLGGLHSHASPFPFGGSLPLATRLPRLTHQGPCVYLSDPAHICSRLSGGRNRKQNTPEQEGGGLADECQALKAGSFLKFPFLGL